MGSRFNLLEHSDNGYSSRARFWRNHAPHYQRADKGARRIIEFAGLEFKMLAIVKLYDQMTDSKDHLSQFSSTANFGEWPMPIWCRMFQQTFDGNARGGLSIFQRVELTNGRNSGNSSLPASLGNCDAVSRLREKFLKPLRCRVVFLSVSSPYESRSGDLTPSGKILTLSPDTVTTSHLIDGLPYGGIDIVIKDLDLEPKIDAMMRDFLKGVVFLLDEWMIDKRICVICVFEDERNGEEYVESENSSSIYRLILG
uniref:Uncharacterized protein n=1 Tax=Tanacetum cinerariifolium TaxID=118510 RepID=A0A6L2JIF3_TANCI|nr:hypothetical protein [Tanacetum cinerariifolium]